MNRLLASLLATTALTLATPAAAQHMPGMHMPAPAKPAANKPTAKKPPARRPAAKKPAARRATIRAPLRAAKPAAPSGAIPTMDHGAMPGMEHGEMPNMATSSAHPADPASPASQEMPGMDMGRGHKGHDMGAMPGMAQAGTALPAGTGSAPPMPMDHYADRDFSPAEMAPSRLEMMREQGGQTLYQVMFNLAEYQAKTGRNGYRWAGEAWVGGDINRLWLKSEGEGAFREGVESAEIQALYSRAVGPYFNLQAGLRHDFRPSPTRTYATIGFEGLAPYMFEIEGALFLSTKGEVLGRLEGYYDQRITQRLILQPRVELNLAAQDIPEIRIGAGLSSVELGLRLRYETSRQVAPYVGISYEGKTGRTAAYARADGKDPATTSFVAGVRFWF